MRLATLADDERDGEVELASVSDIVAMAGAWAGALGIGVLEDDPPA